MSSILTWLLSFLSGPLLTGLLNAYKAKLAAANTTDKLSVDLAVADLQAQIEARKASVALATNPLMAVLMFFMAFPVAVYINKIILWDKILALGTTDPLTGWIGVVSTTIVGFFFGGQIVSSAVNAVLTRFRK